MVTSTLQYPPAIGYETQSCNALGFYQHQALADCPKEESLLHRFFFVPPFMATCCCDCWLGQSIVHLIHQNAQAGGDVPESILDNLYIVNMLKILAYTLPFIGLCRLYAMYHVPAEILPNRVNHVVRGILEVIGFGPLLFIVDIVITVYRQCYLEPQIYHY